MKKNIKNRYLLLVLIVILLFVLDYILLVPLNLRYMNIYFIFIVVVSAILIIITLKKTMASVTFNNKGRVNLDYDRSKKANKIIFRVIFVLFISIFVLPIISSPIFFASSYAALIGEIETKEFSSDFSNPNLDDLPVVDKDYAKVLGDKKIGSTSGLGSEFHVGKYTDIVYNERFYAVAPLEYNDFFKWLNNNDKGTPGYILIDKATTEVTLVQEINGKKVNLKYVDSAYLNQDLKRKAYFNGGFNNLLMDPFFELDDEGMPYFIFPKSKKTIGWSGGDDVYQLIVVNATNGDTKAYDIGNQPKWIDNVYPVDLVMQQLNYYGRYLNGFLNSIFSQEQLLQTTSGSRRIYNEGLLSAYTGLTSVGADESTVGMAFVDVKTKDPIIYSLTGATEVAAMKSAEGKVQDQGYRASFPIPISINGEGTYFITLKDAEGLIKQYAFVNVNEYSLVETSPSITTAYENYLDLIGYEHQVDTSTLEEQQGKIVRIDSEVIKGNTVYTLLVEISGTNYLYIVNNINDELAISQVGDQVLLKIDNDRILEFDNLNIAYENKK